MNDTLSQEPLRLRLPMIDRVYSSKVRIALGVPLGLLLMGCRAQLQPGLPPEIKDAPAPTCRSMPTLSEYQATLVARRRATQGWLVRLGKDGTSYAIKTVGPSSTDLVSAVNLPSGDIVLVGSVLAPDSPCEQPLLIVLDHYGHERTISVLPSAGRLLSALPLPDGGFLVGGVADNPASDTASVGIISRLDASGAVSWTRVAEGLRNGIVAIRAQGDHALLFGVTGGDTWLIGSDWNGKIGSSDPVADFETRSLLGTPEGHWLLFGQELSYSPHYKAVPAVVRLGTDGRSVLARTRFDANSSDWGTFETAVRLPDSQILAGGCLDNEYLNSACVTRMKASGQETWSGCLPASATISALMPVSTDRAVVCLRSESYDGALRLSIPAYELQLVWLRDKKLRALPLGIAGAKLTVCHSLTTLSDGNIVVLGAGKWLARSREGEDR